MELALGAMASLAPKLGELLMQEYVVQKGLKPDIESLSRELLMMKASLKDSSRQPPDQLSEVDKEWARRVRELSYDIEDVVDDFIQRVAGGESASPAVDANIFKKILHKATTMMKKVKDRHQKIDEVKEIKKLSNELAELRAKYTVRGAGANLAASTGIDPRVLNLYKKESDLVGIEESRDKVIRMLSVGTQDGAQTYVSNQSLKIVSIAGVGGLGKTTLAKTVYDMLKKQFGCCAFISVGRTPNLAWTFKKMLMELDKEYKQIDMAGWDVERFCNELQQFLEHKRYFIVVDDIWDKESWEAIKYALKDNNCGSRIIMTTRNFEVITKEELYRLKNLSDENSTKLFYKRIQRREGESLDVVSGDLPSKILSKCGGIPLAIIAIASLLVDRPREDWSNVYDSIVFGNGDNTEKILSYSYYDLPSYLKPCLLHLSIYRENSAKDTKYIIWRWIAEGFVHLETEEVGSLFEVGERYFNELVNRSMIQPVEEKFGRFRQKFRIHDIVFDLIRKISRAENFITMLDSREQQASLDSLRSQKKTSMLRLDSKVRQLVLRNYHVQHHPEYIIDMPKVLRSLNIVHCKIETMVPLHSFRVCRVLYIQGSYVPTTSLKHLGRLLHVKYLEITDTPVDELPMEIGCLKSLQTLVLYNNTGLDELPPTVCSLTQLMCLTAVGFKRFPANRIGYLTSLEELRLKSIDGRSDMEDLVIELGKLTRLRVVSINFSVELEESLQKSLVQSLCNLQELKELKLSSKGLSQQGATVWEDWEVSRQLRRLRIDGIIFSRWPGRINRSHLPCLCFLSLTVYVVEVQDLDNLARLPELSYLLLYGASWPPWYAVGTDGFKNLRRCNVSTTLKFHMGAMPRLEVLEFWVFAGYWSWEKDGLPLEQFPTKDVIKDFNLGPDNLISLEQVTIRVDCSGATTAEVEEVEAMVKCAVQNHPNHPTIAMDRVHEKNILSEECRVALLQKHIEKHISVLERKDNPDASFIVKLQSYRNLERAIISIDCVGADMCEVEKVEAALRHAAEVHRNHPTIQLIRTNTDEMSTSSNTERHIELQGHVLKWKDVPRAFLIRVLLSRPHLEKAVISIDCAGASKCEVEKVEAAFRHAAEVHHNRPTIQLIRRNTDEIELISLIAERFERFPTDKAGNLISLVELRLKSVVGRSATEDLVVELGKQTRLRHVSITFSEDLEENLQKALVQSLCNLQELQELELSFTKSQQGATLWEEDWEAPRQLQFLVILDITFSRLPRWINRSRLPLLGFLSLRVYVVEVIDLDNLGGLPELSQLDLVSYSKPPGYTVGTDGFRNMRFCSMGTTLKFRMGAMPRLEELEFAVFPGYGSFHVDGVPLVQFPTKDVIEDLDLGLDNLPSLESVSVVVDCWGATAAEVQEVEEVVKRAVENHPSRPSTKMSREYEEEILSDEEREARLQHQIEEHFGVLEWKDKPDASFISKLQRYRVLQKAIISIDCTGGSMCEVEKVEAALKQAAKVHHNHPTIQLIRDNTDKMLPSSEHPDTELQLDDDHDDSPDNLLCKLQLRN